MEAVLGAAAVGGRRALRARARCRARICASAGAGSATFLPLEHLPTCRPPLTPRTATACGWVVPAAWRRRATGRCCTTCSAGGRRGASRRGRGALATQRRRGDVRHAAGEVLAPTGRLRVARRRTADAEHSLLGRKRELRELEDEVARLHRRRRRGSGRRSARSKAEVATLRARLPPRTSAIHARQAERLAGEKDLEQTAREQERSSPRETVVPSRARSRREAARRSARWRARAAHRRRARSGGEHESAMAGVRDSIEAGPGRETALVASSPRAGWSWPRRRACRRRWAVSSGGSTRSRPI